MSIRDDLKAYLDGELPPVRMAEIREAVDRDPALAQELSELESLAVAVQTYASQPQAVGLEQTLAALNRGARRRVAWYAWPLGLTGAAAVAFGLLFPIFLQPQMKAKAPAFKGTVERAAADVVAMDSAKSSSSLASPIRPKRRDFTDGASLKAEGRDLRTQAQPEVAKAQRLPEMPRLRAKSPTAAPPHHGDEAAKAPFVPLQKGLTASAGKSHAAQVPKRREEKGAPRDSELQAAAPSAPPAGQLKKSYDGLNSDTVSTVLTPATDLRERSEMPPIVLEVASVEEAQVKLQALANKLEGRLVSSAAATAVLQNTLKRDRSTKSEATERKLVLDVPESKAALAIVELKKVGEEPLPLAFGARVGASKADLSDVAQGRSGGVGGGGIGGGGFGGGNGATGGPGGPGGGFGGPPSEAGGNVSANRTLAPAASKAVPPLRRKIVIVIRKKAPATQGVPPPKGDPQPEGSEPGNL